MRRFNGRISSTARRSGPEQFGIIQKPLTLAEKIYNQTWLRKVSIIVVLAVAWQLYGVWLDNPLLVPTFADTVRALVEDVGNGTIPSRALSSIEVLLVGFATGTVLAGLAHRVRDHRRVSAPTSSRP